MKRTVLAAVMLAVSAVTAEAHPDRDRTPDHDRQIEEAVKKIVAETIGDLRPGFSFGQKPEFIVVPESLDRMTTGSLA